jgi:hypothetical protein
VSPPVSPADHQVKDAGFAGANPLVPGYAVQALREANAAAGRAALCFDGQIVTSQNNRLLRRIFAIL